MRNMLCNVELCTCIFSLLSITAVFGSSKLRPTPLGSFWKGPSCRVHDEGSNSKSPETLVLSYSPIIIYTVCPVLYLLFDPL